MKASLSGSVAIVTGAARGIGRAIALRLAEAGADITIVDLDLSGSKKWGEELSADSVHGEIEALGRRCVAVEGDLGQRAVAEQMVQRTIEQLGKVDILVNCAGGAISPAETSFASTTPDRDLDTVFLANYRSAVNCCQSVIPHMQQRGNGGSIVNFSSSAGITAPKDGKLAHYAATKAAVTSYTRSLANELGPVGVRVNAVAPGIILTARVATLAKERGLGTDEQMAQIPLRRFGKADDIAKVVEFLASDHASYVTGQCIAVDGGNFSGPS